MRSHPAIRAVYETDILFKNRFLIDRSLGGMGWVEADVPDWTLDQNSGSMPGGRSLPPVGVASIRPVENEANAPLRLMSFDIECLPDHGAMPKAEKSPVILISMAFEPEFQGNKELVLVGKEIDCPRPDTRACRNEYDLLAQFAAIIRDTIPISSLATTPMSSIFPIYRRGQNICSSISKWEGTAVPGILEG